MHCVPHVLCLVFFSHSSPSLSWSSRLSICMLRYSCPLVRSVILLSPFTNAFPLIAMQVFEIFSLACFKNYRNYIIQLLQYYIFHFMESTTVILLSFLLDTLVVFILPLPFVNRNVTTPPSPSSFLMSTPPASSLSFMPSDIVASPHNHYACEDVRQTLNYNNVPRWSKSKQKSFELNVISFFRQ